jgi:DNA modification methylase
VSNFCRLCGAWRGSLGLEPTPELFVAHLVEIMREVRRVLRDDGTLWLNLGSSYAGSGKGIGSDHGKAVFTDDDITRTNWRLSSFKPKDLVPIPWMAAMALQEDGWYLRCDIIWAKPNPMPESVTDRPTKAHEYLFLLAKSRTYYYDAEAVREPHARDWADEHRPVGGRKHRLDGGPMARNGSGQYDRDWDARDYSAKMNLSGRNRRSVWTIATQPYKGAHFATYPEALVEPCILAGTSAKGCCPKCGAPWQRIIGKATKQRIPRYPGDERLRETKMHGPPSWNAYETLGWRPTCACDAGEAVPATVLDPFCGSGTTIAVALRLGRHGIGIELNPDYVAMAERRLARLPRRLL